MGLVTLRRIALARRPCPPLSVEYQPATDVPGHFLPVHLYLLAEQGAPMMEIAYLDELARDRVYEFAFFGAPLRLRGATGSPSIHWNAAARMSRHAQDTAPNRITFLVNDVYRFRVAVRRSGCTDTITSADLSLRKDGVNARDAGREPVGEHTRLTHRCSLRLVPESVDRFDARMTIAIALGEPGSSEQER